MTEPDMRLKPRLERLGERVQPRSDAFDRLDRARAKRTRARRAGTIVLALIVAVAGSWGALAALRADGDGAPAVAPTTPPPTRSARPVIVPTCADAPTASLSITAKDIQWSVSCWNAPADTALSIRYHNRDVDVPNGINIEPIDSCMGQGILAGSFIDCPDPSHVVFEGDLVTGPERVTYDVGLLPAGEYIVYDPVHPVSSYATLFVP